MRPWEQQPVESARAFAAFAQYRDAGPGRSHDTVYRAHCARNGRDVSGGASGQWSRWSAEHRWTERAAAWDAHCDAQRLKARLDAMRQIEERRFMLELIEQERIERRLEKMDGVLERAEAAPATDITKTEIREDGKTVVKVKGILLSGYARLNAARAAISRQAILGVRDAPAVSGAVEEGAGGLSGAAEFVWVPPAPGCSEEK